MGQNRDLSGSLQNTAGQTHHQPIQTSHTRNPRGPSAIVITSLTFGDIGGPSNSTVAPTVDNPSPRRANDPKGIRAADGKQISMLLAHPNSFSFILLL